MGKQTRSKKSDTNVVGKGKVTPVQVAFIVDCYLANNNFSGTRSLFRSEASSILPKCEAVKGLLRLEDMLDEYVLLKEQKVMVDQTMYLLNLEKTKFQTILQGNRNLLNAYNEYAASSCTTSPLPPYSDCSPVPSMLSNSLDFSSAETPLSTPESVPDHRNTLDPAMFMTPVLNPHPPRKRKSCEADPNIFDPTKKACGLTSGNQSTYPGKITRQPRGHVASTQDTIKGSSTSSSIVAKNLFNSSSEIPNSNSSGLQTPKRSNSSRSDKSISSQEEMYLDVKASLPSSSVETTPINCSIIASKTVLVNSPAKHCAFSSPSKRDQIKGRLDFGNTDLPVIAKDVCPDFYTTSDSEKDGDLFDFEPLSSNFSFSELLHDFGIDCEVFGHSREEAICASTDPLIGSLTRPYEGNFLVSQNLTEQDLTTKGSDSITSGRSIAQCIQISSPSKKATSSTQESTRSY